MRLRKTEKKDVWQGAWLAIYEMDWGRWVLGGKWENMAYELFRLSWHHIVEDLLESNREYGTAKKISFQTRGEKKYCGVTHKRQRKINKDWHGDRERGWKVDYLWVHLKCASWSCCWSGLDASMWILTAYWRRQRLCSLRWWLHTSSRNKQSGKHPEEGEAINVHPGTNKGSHKHVCHSDFTSPPFRGLQRIQDTQVTT